VATTGRTSDARERLLEAAWELIGARTYGAVGVEAICESAGVRKGSFYHFFESKADLAIRSLEDHWQRYLPGLRRTFSPETPPIDRLLGYFDELVRHHRERSAEGKPVCGCPYLHVGSEMAQDNREILRQSRREACDQGSVEGDPETLARYVFAFHEGVLALARVHDDPECLEDLIPGTRRILGLHP
jgi:TetR/AcrR family transcriptional repressor of nem operon